VHSFLQETPNNLLTDKHIQTKSTENKDLKSLNEITEINDLIPLISNLKSDLQKTAKNLVLFDGDTKSKLMIVGEAPGQEEDEQGLPFVGSVGQLLNKMLSAIQLDRKDIYVTNALPWRLPQNRTATDQEILEFLPFLQRQIEIIKPKCIYVLGTTAAKAILSTPLSLDELRGKWHSYKSINMDRSIKVLVSYHPAFLLQSPKFKKEAWGDLQMLQKKLNEN
jgi:uracil-DNA glycosylase family 4